MKGKEIRHPVTSFLNYPFERFAPFLTDLKVHPFKMTTLLNQNLSL